MYFYKLKGKQMLDLRGNLILSHNDALVKGRIPSAAPRGIRNPKYILLQSMGFISKIKATWHAIGFIWGESQALDAIKEGL